MVHDLAESLVGDITPYDGVSKETKRKLEEVSDYVMRSVVVIITIFLTMNMIVITITYKL